MHALKLIYRNALRHKIRTGLTVFGLLIAVLAYGLLQTVVDAWYAGADAASKTRLITRSSISLAFTLPVSYEARIRGADGVSSVARATWFGGIYREPKNFFPQFAISANYLDLYPEFLLPEAERQMWLRDRKGALVGRQLANQYGFKVGDIIPLRGSIYPGDWQFVVRGIFDGADDTKITNQMFFHWTYLNEWLRQRPGRRTMCHAQRIEELEVLILDMLPIVRRDPMRREKGIHVARPCPIETQLDRAPRERGDQPSLEVHLERQHDIKRSRGECPANREKLTPSLCAIEQDNLVNQRMSADQCCRSRLQHPGDHAGRRVRLEGMDERHDVHRVANGTHHHDADPI